MSKKGKGKGKKGKASIAVVEEKEKMAEVDRAFYELTIQDTKKKITHLRNHIQNLLVSNDNIVEEVRAITVGKASKSAELEDGINELESRVIELKSDNATLTDEFNEEKRKKEETISDLEEKYDAMHIQLSAEIKRLNGRLNACEELRQNWDNWMVKYGERADAMAAKEEEFEEILRQIESKTVYENEQLKEDLLEKLTLAGEEFTLSGSKNSADFNMRLIRENIALQKNIDLLTNSNNEMDMRIKQEIELYESNKVDIPKLEKKNSQLVLESQEKIEIIKMLTKQVQELKKEYISSLSYREQNISFKEFQMCARFRRKKLKSTVYAVGQQIKSMNREINLYEYLIEEYKVETQKIVQHLEHIRSTIERSLLVKDQEHINFDMPEEKMKLLWRERNDLLGILVDLLHLDFDIFDPDHSASITTIAGYDKLTRFDSLFKKEAPSLSSLMDICVAYIDSEEESGGIPSSVTAAYKAAAKSDLFEYQPYTPVQRPLGRNLLFDVESGTSLYFSSSRGDPERALVEEQQAAADEEEEEATTESWSSADGDKEKETTEAPLTATTNVTDQNAASKLPPGTIVDVVSEEEFDEEPVPEEYVEENEEYDINLFY